MKNEETVVTIKMEDNLADSKLLVFYALFANMAGDSEGEHIIFWSDAFRNNMNPIAWESYRIEL